MRPFMLYDRGPWNRRRGTRVYRVYCNPQFTPLRLPTYPTPGLIEQQIRPFRQQVAHFKHLMARGNRIYVQLGTGPWTDLRHSDPWQDIVSIIINYTPAGMIPHWDHFM